MGANGTTAFAAALPRCRALRSLSIHSNSNDVSSGDAGALALGIALAASSTALTELSLSHCGLDAEGAAGIAKGLRSNQSLLTLNLNNNKNIFNAGFRALGAALTANSTLTNLALSSCGIQAQGAVYLAEGLSSNNALKIMSLDNNPIGNAGFGAIASVLASNKALRTLTVSSCNIGEESMPALGHSIGSNATLLELYLPNNCSIGDAAGRVRVVLRPRCEHLADEPESR